MKSLLFLALLPLCVSAQMISEINAGITFSGGGSTVATPTDSPGTGTYTTSQAVTLNDATAGSSICYTTDGSTPTAPVPGTCSGGTTATYSGPISVTATTTIKALGTKSGLTNSGVLSTTYTIQVATPTDAPGAGTYGSTQSVTLSDATGGSTICYTTDGSTPTAPVPGTCSGGTTSTYSTAISVSVTTTIKAIGTKSGLINSGVLSSTYTITAGGAPTFVSSTACTTGTGNGCTTPGISIAGSNLLLACVGSVDGSGSNPKPPVTDSNSNTWNKLPLLANNIQWTGNNGVQVWYSTPSTTTGTPTFTVSGVNTFSGLTVLALSNANATPLDQFATDIVVSSQSVSALNSNEVIPGWTNELLFACATTSGAPSGTSFASGTLSGVAGMQYPWVNSNNYSAASGYLTDTAGTPSVNGFTWTGTSTNSAIETVAVKGTGSVAVTTPFLKKGHTDCVGTANCTTPQVDCSGANMLVAAVTNFGSALSTDISIADSTGLNTWSNSSEITGSGYGVIYYWVYSANVASNQTFTVTSAGSHFPSMAVACYNRTSGASPGLDTANSGVSNCYGGANQTCQGGSVTPAAANELMLTAGTVRNTSGVGSGDFLSATDGTLPPAVMPPVNPLGSNIFLGWNITAGTSAVNPTWQMSNGTSAGNDSTLTIFLK